MSKIVLIILALVGLVGVGLSHNALANTPPSGLIAGNGGGTNPSGGSGGNMGNENPSGGNANGNFGPIGGNENGNGGSSEAAGGNEGGFIGHWHHHANGGWNPNGFIHRHFHHHFFGSDQPLKFDGLIGDETLR